MFEHMRSAVIFSLFFALPLFGVGCNAVPISKSISESQDSVPSIQQDVKSDEFEKKEQCAKYLNQAQAIVDQRNGAFSGYNDLGNGKHQTGHSMLEKTCFSKANNSCFALITERDRVYPNGYDDETFVIIDLLSGERTNVSKTIFSDDSSGTATEKMITFSSAKEGLLKGVDCLY